MPQAVRGGGLSRDQVARAALELIDAEGIDTLSMRRLASHLGVGTMTLYGYVGSKTELLEAAVDAAAADFEPVQLEGSVRERARANLLAVRSWIKRHPGLIHLQGHEAFGRPSMRALAQVCQGFLRETGVPDDEIAPAFRLMMSYVFGATVFAPTDSDETFVWGLERLFDGVEARAEQLS